MMERYRGEVGYQQLLNNIISNGIETPDRTGVGRIKLFDQKLIFNLAKNRFPAHTLRPCPLRIAFEEFWGFLNGVVHIDPYLKSKNINIWEGNTSREFLDNRGLTHLPEGHLGKTYGFQFRNFNGGFGVGFECDASGIDQISKVHKSLKDDPYGSRHYVTIWNPSQEHEMALPPCWLAHQFVVIPDGDKKVLNLKTYARSADVLFGTPFNVQQYALYQMAMAESLGMEVGVLSCDLADAHLYLNQIDYATECGQREIFEPPTLQWLKNIQTLDDILSLTMDDFELTNLVVNKSKFIAPKPSMAI